MNEENVNPIANEENSNPIETLLDQLHSLLNSIENKEGRLVNDSELPPDIHAKLAELEAKVQIFHNLSEQIVVQSDLSREEMLKRLHGTAEDLPPDGKRLIEKANDLQRKALKINENQKLPGVFADEDLPPSDQKTDFERSQVKTTKKSISKRRRKFQGMGDDKV